MSGIGDAPDPRLRAFHRHDLAFGQTMSEFEAGSLERGDGGEGGILIPDICVARRTDATLARVRSAPQD